ncbi:MAG: hypothetical protein OYM47_02160 [Gemmatimonadota bacterium]|nr:hypothetical protein [Gemmatimonadota bacterium]
MWKYVAVWLCLAFALVGVTWTGDVTVSSAVSGQSSQCPGDFNGDGKVNLADFLVFAGGFGARSGDANFNARLDLDGSGAVDLSDFLAFAGVFGTKCEDRPRGSVSGDRAALVALYNATDGPNWNDNTNWLTDAPLGEWYGVHTDGSGRVTDLQLPDNTLEGVIPPELGNLSELRDLHLDSNALTGPIPPELGALAELSQLQISNNKLTGSLPAELGSLAKLGRLWLFGNGLTGSIPPELGELTNVYLLWLENNKLTGPIPPELGNLTSVQSLDLSNNELTGSIPPELGNLNGLEQLGLTGNMLTGVVPRTFLGLKLHGFSCQKSEGVCLPATDAFREWARQVVARGAVDFPVNIPFCDEMDRSALESLFDATDGSAWTRSDGWLEDEDLGQWHGVRTDSVGRVAGLDLSGNGLSGYVPEAVGMLAVMTELRLRDNALAGRLPRSLVGIPLGEFDYRATSLCVPDDAGFRNWLNGIPHHSGTGVQCPPLTEREILEWLYRNTNGRNWTESAGWMTDAPLAEWHGVKTDAAGRVVELRLSWNELSGPIPVELGQLSELRILHLRGNQLSGSIPAELGNLGRLDRLSLGRNQLSGNIPPELGKLSELGGLSLSVNRLSGSIPAELGNLGRLGWLWLDSNQLSGNIPPELGKLSELTSLDASNNGLSGSIPPELGELSRLRRLLLAGNQLDGSIPSELDNLGMVESIDLADNRLTGRISPGIGALDRLSVLDLSGNHLTGSIPAEVGRLASLRELSFFGNDLSGLIPSDLGKLSKLATLDLGENELTGPLPAELGRATNLESLDLRSNALSGPVPAEFGNLILLTSLILANNADLAGPLPSDLTALTQLERFMAGGTGLCRPAESDFDAWFRNIADRRLVRCEGGATVYLTQTVQSWDDPVPLLAGEPALLRVFVTTPGGDTATMPAVRATFYTDGGELHSVDIPASTHTIPTEVTEGDLEVSANAEIPSWLIAPGLEMVIEVDPGGTLDPALGVTKRIPDSGRLAVDVRSLAPFRLTLIPFLTAGDPDSRAVETVAEMSADPTGSHELLDDVRTILPVGELVVIAHEHVTTSFRNSRQRLTQVKAMRLMERGTGYWMGVFAQPRPSRTTFPNVGSVGEPQSMIDVEAGSRVVAHELGHNLGLLHAPCGINVSGVDPWFPHRGGRIGVYGYDPERRALVDPGAHDIMSYCRDNYWISDFFYNKAFDHRLTEVAPEPAAVLAEKAASVPTLLLWGGRDKGGVPYLDPAFVVDAVPSLPTAGVEYTIEGANDVGTPVFSYAFDMPVTGCSEGKETSFVFALPLQPEWAGNLATITLSGLGGSATLDETTDRPMAILRDLQTGHVRGFLSDLTAEETAQATEGAFAAKPGVKVIFSRGIPELR